MIYECAYCDEIARFTGPLLIKYGWAESYECSKHGTYYMMLSPLCIGGQQIGPVDE